jgi:AcrR family transcriptional regulator
MRSPSDLNARILHEARRLTAEQGDAWSMVDLARAAKISRASLYRRFPSRDALSAALTAVSEDLSEEPPQNLSVRERALDAFQAVARRRGIAAATLELVAAEAGLGVATIYRHFGGREGLLDAYAHERTPRALASRLSFTPVVTLHQLRAALEQITRALLQHLIDQGPVFFLAGLAPDPDSRPAIAHLTRLEAEGRAHLTAFFAAQAERGLLRGDPDHLSKSLIGLAVGAVFLHGPLAAPPSLPVDQLAAQLTALLLHGCAPPLDEERSR